VLTEDAGLVILYGVNSFATLMMNSASPQSLKWHLKPRMLTSNRRGIQERPPKPQREDLQARREALKGRRWIGDEE